MPNARNKALPVAVVALALLVAAAVPSTARAADWSAFLSWYDTSDLQDALGLGVRVSFPFKETLEFDITGSYYEDFKNAIPGSAQVEIGTIPVDFGITWTKSPEGGFYAGGGLTWAFMDTGGLEIAGRDIPDPGEADDEFGGYGKLGWRHANGFMVEVLYRYLDVSIESIQIPPEIIVLDPPTRIDLNMDGFVVNVGYRF